MSKIGIIGGSGIYNLEKVTIVKEHSVETPFGFPSDNIKEIKIGDYHFYFVPRHGVGHRISPSEINYRANIFALKKLGVQIIISVSAVGSLKEEHNPTSIVLPSQFIDWTKGLRERTFFTDGIVGHVSTAYPVEVKLQERIASILNEIEIKYSVGGTYLCIEGPQFSSRAESDLYRSFGADVIGMTNVPEAYLAKEAGIAYATVAMVTDYDCWKTEHCSLEEIMKVMNKNYESAQKLLLKLIPSLSEEPILFTPENQFCVVTDEKFITPTQHDMLSILLHNGP